MVTIVFFPMFNDFHLKQKAEEPPPAGTSVCSACMFIHRHQDGNEDEFFYKTGPKNKCVHSCDLHLKTHNIPVNHRWLRNLKRKHAMKRRRCGKPNFKPTVAPKMSKHQCIARELPHASGKGAIRCCLCIAYHKKNCKCGNPSILFYKKMKKDSCRKSLESRCTLQKDEVMPTLSEIRKEKHKKPRSVYYPVKKQYKSEYMQTLAREAKRAGQEDFIDEFVVDNLSEEDGEPGNQAVPEQQPDTPPSRRIVPTLTSPKHDVVHFDI